MKKILTTIIVVGIILGLGFGGYWIYTKMNRNISSELEKIEINPDERKEIVGNLSTKDEKIDMIIQLIEDINYDRIFYNDEFFGIFHVKNKYEIDYIVDGVAIGGYDYLGRHYVAGERNAGIMWITGSDMVYVWSEYKKECSYTGLESTIVKLAFEDELLCGKYNMGYKHTSGDGTYYKQFSEKIKNNKDEMQFSEKDNVYYLICKKKYADGTTSSFDDFIIETDGITYIHIKSEYEGKLDSGEDSYRYDHYIEINNKQLYEKIIAPIKDVKEFPEFKMENQPVLDTLHDIQSKYDHKQLMADYISSIEPKDQTWTVNDIKNQETWNTLFCDKEKLLLDWKLSGELTSSQTINLLLNLELTLDKNVMTMTETDGVTTVRIVADTDDIVKMSKGSVDDFSLTMTMVVQSDLSYTCEYNATLSYKSEEVSFKQTFLGKESGKIKDKFVDETTLVSAISSTISNLVVKDANNNQYVCDESKLDFSGHDSIVTLIAYYLYK